MNTSVPEPTDLLPLTPAVFHILLALADGERHGYGIMQEIVLRRESGLRIGPGTLYRSLQRMVDDQLIVEVETRADPQVDDERRRYYRITDFGRHVAHAEAARLEQLVALAREKRLLPMNNAMPGDAGAYQ